MSLWLSITLIAYFLNALAMVIDKTLLKKAIQNPFVYTFYIAILGAVLMLFVVPFGLTYPGLNQLIISLFAGATFSVGLFLMFWGLKREDASRLTPMIGGLTPVFVFLLAYFFLHESLSSKQTQAFFFIIIGTFLLSLEFNRQRGVLVWLKQKITGQRLYILPQVRRTLWLALPAAFFFGLSYVLTKDVYNHLPFLTGFIWTRLGVFIAAFLPMLIKRNRHDLLHGPKDPNTSQTRYRFLFGQACGGVSALLIQYAISLASVSLIQAIQGVQYIFVFLAVVFLTYRYPKILQEKMSLQIIIQKTMAIILISFGIWQII